MILRHFPIKINREKVFFMLDCQRDNPVYEQVEEEFIALSHILYDSIEPVAGMAPGIITKELVADSLFHRCREGKEAVFVLLSIGRRGSELVSELFARGEYLRGMVADVMLDEYLFQLDLAMKPYLIRIAKEKDRGIAGRLEAPAGIGIQALKKIHELLDAEHTMKIKINESYMYDPVKTMGLVYPLSEEAGKYHVDHDCSKCEQKECRFRPEKE